MQAVAERRLGQILLRRGALSPEQLARALDEQASRPGELLGEALLRAGACDRRTLFQAVAEQLGVPYVDLEPRLADPDILDLVPEVLRRRHGVAPMFLVEGALTLAMAEPTNVFAIEDVERETGARVQPVLATPEAIAAIGSRAADAAEAAFGIAELIEAPRAGGAEALLAEADALLGDLTVPDAMHELPPVIRVVNYIIYRGVKEGASDIHVEPYERVLRVRYRVDGVLHEAFRPPMTMLEPICSRLKIMADLDIGERRLPQDGRIRVLYEGRRIDLRLSLMPTAFGEKAVLRILDREAAILPLDALGFAPDVCASFRELVRRPHGIILVTGPTGSGKTTTLYSALHEINDERLNISTVEDPIEYNLEFVNQVQTSAKIGLRFATVLRSLLRQDPDVVMIGEIRDKETAEIAVQAALTGHLVLSTLHTNDAPGAITRLLNMGIESYLVSSALTAVLAQRLVRKVCSSCRRERAPTAAEVGLLAAEGRSAAAVYQGKGCLQCRDSGYRGRLGIYELLVPDEGMREQITTAVPLGELRRYAEEALRMRTLRQDAVSKALSGATSLGEVFRITVES